MLINLKIKSICFLCNQYHFEKHAVCNECFDLLQPIGHHCCVCALPIANYSNDICNSCAFAKPYIDKVFTAFKYDDYLRRILHEFKYNNGIYLTKLLTSLMLKSNFNQSSLKCLVPVPLHKKRLQKRGFNQAALLTKNLSKAINIPYDLLNIVKLVNTESQISLPSKERRLNLKNVFAINKLPAKEITLIDDIITTGSTANEIAKILKERGATKVYLWCAARAIKSK
jgi:ComF family protein